jgi:Uma2 family endonuclease
VTTTARVAGGSRRLLTIDEYDRMARVGIFGPEERVELILGELVRMAPIGSRHAASVANLQDWFVPRLPRSAALRVQSPIRIPQHSEPEPHIVIVRRRTDGYVERHPEPEDILLVIEVADTTLRYDRDVKMSLYAAAEIMEAWLVDLPRRRILVYRQPVDDVYREVTVVRDGTLTPLASPDLSIRLDEIIP